MKMTAIDHQNAHRLIQDSLTIPLSEEKRSNLDAHLNSCTECTLYTVQTVALENQLRWSFHKRWDTISGPSAKIFYVITEKMGARLRRRAFINYLSVATFTVIIVTLIISAISVLPERGIPLTSNQTSDNSVNVVLPTLSSEPEITSTAPLVLPASTPTEQNEDADQTAKLETFADVDLDCDGSIERILVEPGNELHYFNNNSTYVRILLGYPSELNHQSLWEYSAQDASVSYLTLLLIHIEECQYFLSVLGDEGSGSGLKVFQWDGERMKDVLHVPGHYLFANPGYIEEVGLTSPPNSFSIMSLMLTGADANNVWVIRVFQWDGVEFKQVIWKEVRSPAGG
jgi:hypothetical protein